MELGIRFNGRKGSAIFPDGKGGDAYARLVIAMAQMGRKVYFMKESRPRFKDAKGEYLSPEKSLKQLVKNVKNADIVVTEIDQIGFAIATFAIFLHGPDDFCLDRRMEK